MARWLGVLLLAGLLAGAARAEPPPEVRGLSVDDARAQLVAWDPSVVIEQAPVLLPAGVDPSTVVVARSSWLNQPTNPNTAAAVRPQIRLILGPRIPDLTGLTPAEVSVALSSRGLRLRSDPDEPPSDWRASAQAFPAGAIVDFGLTVGVTFAEPGSGPARRGSVFGAIASTVGGALAMLALLGLVLVLRDRARRRRTRAVAERVDVRGHPGVVVGPELSEPGVSVSVRLVARSDAGTLRIEEVSS